MLALVTAFRTRFQITAWLERAGINVEEECVISSSKSEANSKPLLMVSRTAQPEELAAGTHRQGDVELRVVAANRIGDGEPENGWRQVSRGV